MEPKKRIFALGFFDGVHLGHQALLRQCVQLARQTGCQSAAITFDRHPKALVWKEPPVLISTGADRHLLLKRFGMDYVRQFPVVPEVTGMPWEDFLQVLLEDGAAGFVCGDDFRFGWKGEGNALRLTEFCNARGLPCIIVPEQLIGGITLTFSVTVAEGCHRRTLVIVTSGTDCNQHGDSSGYSAIQELHFPLHNFVWFSIYYRTILQIL